MIMIRQVGWFGRRRLIATTRGQASDVIRDLECLVVVAY
jgi:hypothetical protein